MRLEAGFVERFVDHVIEDQLAEPARVADHVLEVGHRQVHESVIRRREDCPRSGCKWNTKGFKSVS